MSKNIIFHVFLLISGALSGKMLLVRIVDNNKTDVYFRACKVR